MNTEVDEICIIHKRKKYKGQRCADCYAIANDISIAENGIQYTCDGVIYYWHNGGFHYKIDRIKHSVETGLELKDIPEWASVCNCKKEQYIKDNCSPDFKENK